MQRSNLKAFFIALLLLTGCTTNNNPGDFSVKSSGTSAILTTSNSVYIGYSAIYGSESVHTDRRKSDTRYGNSNLLVSLFILLPQDEAWSYVGGGNDSAPWYYRLFYSSTRWLLYPKLYFANKNSAGTLDLENKKTVSWSFNGKKKSITIADNTYAISAGDYAIVKFDKHWDPEVRIGEASFKNLQITPKTKNTILNCYLTIKKGIQAIGKCKQPL